MTTETTGRSVIPALVTEYLEVRDQANEITRRRDALRKRLMPLLEDAGGSYIDEIAGVRLVIERQVRWEYDATKLHECVKAGVLAAEFSECLVTSVDKAAVQAWIDKGLIRERDLAPAKVGSKIIPQLTVAPLTGDRRVRA